MPLRSRAYDPAVAGTTEQGVMAASRIAVRGAIAANVAEVLLAIDVEFKPETSASEVPAAIAQMERTIGERFVPRSSEDLGARGGASEDYFPTARNRFRDRVSAGCGPASIAC
jgi:hypothetical protein